MSNIAMIFQREAGRQQPIHRLDIESLARDVPVVTQLIQEQAGSLLLL